MSYVGRMPNGLDSAARGGLASARSMATDHLAVGRRIRAALALSGQTPEDVAEELNVSPRTLSRMIAGDRQARDWELRRLAELLEVPLWFLTDGLQPAAKPEDLLETLLDEVRALDRKLDERGDLDEKLAPLVDALRELGDEVRAR